MIDEVVKIVYGVGQKLIEWRDNGGANGEWIGTQFKAEADIKAHEMLTENLEKISPGIPIISEEDFTTWTHKRPNEYWIIDPIDGTASYANGFPGFVTQVALIQNNQPVLAAIYAPELNEIYSAVKDGKAYFNNKEIFIPLKKRCTTLIDNYPEPKGIALEAFQQLGFSQYVECGSIALKICKVATEIADIFFKDVTVRDWDIGAPQLIIETAGGFISNLNGDYFRYCEDYNHIGLVAAMNRSDALRLISWYKDRKLES